MMLISSLGTGALASSSVPPDLLIVPGRSVGLVCLGSNAASVKQALGQPDREQAGNWIEYNQGAEKLDVFFIDDAASEIRFNSKKYKTADGLGLANYNDKKWHSKFDYARVQTKFINARMCLKTGGLAFYRMNIDGTKDYPLSSAALVYNTERPVHQPRMYMGEPDGGWEEWDGDPATLFEEFKSPLSKGQHGIDGLDE